MFTSSDNLSSHRGKRKRRREPEPADEEGDTKLPARESNVTIKIKLVDSHEVLTFIMVIRLTVLDLKRRICELNSIDIPRQRLIYSGRILKDDETFEKIGMKIGSVCFVHLSPLPVGQQPSNRNETLSGGSTSFTDAARMAEAAIRAIRSRRNAVREATNQSRSSAMSRSRDIYEQSDISSTETVAVTGTEGHAGLTVESTPVRPHTRGSEASINVPSHGGNFEASQIQVGLENSSPHLISLASMQMPQIRGLFGYSGVAAPRLIPINVEGITTGIDLMTEQLIRSMNEVPHHHNMPQQSAGITMMNPIPSILSRTYMYNPLSGNGLSTNASPSHRFAVGSANNTEPGRMASSTLQPNGGTFPCEGDIAEANEALNRLLNSLSQRGIRTVHQSERDLSMPILEIRVAERTIDTGTLAAMLRQLWSVNNGLSSDLFNLSDQVRNANAWYGVRNNQLQSQINTVSSELEDISTATRVISRLLRDIRVPGNDSLGLNHR